MYLAILLISKEKSLEAEIEMSDNILQRKYCAENLGR
jgi:hypothetical protein